MFMQQEPVSVTLGSRVKWRKRKHRCCAVKVKDTFQYIPLLDSLKVTTVMLMYIAMPLLRADFVIESLLCENDYRYF